MLFRHVWMCEWHSGDVIPMLYALQLKIWTMLVNVKPGLLEMGGCVKVSVVY